MEDQSKKKPVGRIVCRAEEYWWVGYYQAETGEAIELGRVQLAVVANHPQRKDTFLKLLQGYAKQTLERAQL